MLNGLVFLLHYPNRCPEQGGPSELQISFFFHLKSILFIKIELFKPQDGLDSLLPTGIWTLSPWFILLSEETFINETEEEPYLFIWNSCKWCGITTSRFMSALLPQDFHVSTWSPQDLLISLSAWVKVY